MGELHCFHYDFIRKHQALGTTPAVASGLATAALTVADQVTMLGRAESAAFCHGRINRDRIN